MMLPPYTPQTKKELLEVQASVFLFAPDAFSVLPNLPASEQQTLESSFDWLRRGIEHVYRKPRHAEALARMREVLDASYAEYSAGHADAGRALIGRFESLVIDTRP
jgi:hypothetical protein